MGAEGGAGATEPSEQRHNVEVQDKKKIKAKTITTPAATGAGARAATAATAARKGGEIYTIWVVIYILDILYTRRCSRKENSTNT